MRRAGSGAKIQFGRFHLQFLGLGAGLIAKLDQGHQHGQTQAAHQDVENSRHVAQAQRLRALVLEAGGAKGKEGEKTVLGTQDVAKRRLKHIYTWQIFNDESEYGKSLQTALITGASDFNIIIKL